MAQRAIGRVGAGARLSRQVQRRLKGMGRLARTQPLGTFGFLICAFMILMAVFAPLVDRYSPIETNPFSPAAAPSAEHWFGTDEFGRDLYSRIIHGARISMQVAFFSVALGTTGGYLLGLVCGYAGGKLDLGLQRVVDALMSFPPLLMAMAMVSVLSPGLSTVIIAISITIVARAARIARGVALSLKENVYVDAARVIGASPLRIMLRHVVPNSLAPYLILASVGLGAAILTEASLSYLGLGVPPPYPCWGRMLSGYAQTYMLAAPWMVLVPGIAISLLVLAFNLFGDAVRDIWDPRMRGR
ncbi:MAG: ABC transporter permease [Chloroflexota bacterium]